MDTEHKVGVGKYEGEKQLDDPSKMGKYYVQWREYDGTL